MGGPPFRPVLVKRWVISPLVPWNRSSSTVSAWPAAISTRPSDWSVLLLLGPPEDRLRHHRFGWQHQVRVRLLPLGGDSSSLTMISTATNSPEKNAIRIRPRLFRGRYYSKRARKIHHARLGGESGGRTVRGIRRSPNPDLYVYVRNIPTSLVDGDGHSMGALRNAGFEGSFTDFNMRQSGGCYRSVQGQKAGPSPAVQVAKDTVVGGSRGVANTVIDLANLVIRAVDSLLSNFTTFQFRQIPEYQAVSPSRKCNGGCFCG